MKCVNTVLMVVYSFHFTVIRRCRQYFTGSLVLAPYGVLRSVISGVEALLTAWQPCSIQPVLSGLPSTQGYRTRIYARHSASAGIAGADIQSASIKMLVNRSAGCTRVDQTPATDAPNCFSPSEVTRCSSRLPAGEM